MSEITYPIDTRKSHKGYIEWMNKLLNDYKSSFYDSAVINVISMAFIRTYATHIQELYQGDGTEYAGFMSVMPTDSVEYLLMIHPNADLVAEPYLWNKQDTSNLFTFDGDGRLTGFSTNITIDLYDAEGNTVAECFITYEDFFGVQFPMYYVKHKESNALIGKGLVDILYSGRTSGTFQVLNTPLEDFPMYIVRNLTIQELHLEIPFLANLNIPHVIGANQAIEVPITEWSTFYLKQAKDGGSITYRVKP